jgi:hypothetical protein
MTEHLRKALITCLWLAGIIWLVSNILIGIRLHG